MVVSVVAEGLIGLHKNVLPLQRRRLMKMIEILSPMDLSLNM